jgi:hypothetical protein
MIIPGTHMFCNTSLHLSALNAVCARIVMRGIAAHGGK